MKGLNKFGKVITKILEIGHWVGSALMALAVVSSVAAPDWVNSIVSLDAKDCCGVNLEVYGFEVNAAVENGEVDMVAFMLFGIVAIVILALMAMIFRNLHFILMKSENAAPFQNDTIRKMREIGIFAITIPVIGIIMSPVICLVIGVEATEISIDMGGVLMGIIVLCLTQFFVRGAELEEDVDGLL